MSEATMCLQEVNRFLDDIYLWVLKNRTGLSREDAKRIFQRYRTGRPGSSKEAPETSPPGENPPNPELQYRKIEQILEYMEETTERLNHIESDIGYLKEKVDEILKKL